MRAETIQVEGYAISGEFTGSVKETEEQIFTTSPALPTNPGENTFVTPPAGGTVPTSDQPISPETTFQTLTSPTGEENPSAEGTFTTSSQPNGGGDGNNGGGGGGGGHSGGSSRRPTPVVSIAPTPVAGYCPVYLTKFIRLGRANDPAEVLKLQRFLRDSEGFANVPLSGFYDLTTYRAVMAFQTRYAKDILTPWGIDFPTGYVFITTTLAINNLHCERDPKTTLDLRYIFTSGGIEEAPSANPAIQVVPATTTPSLPIDELEMGVATSSSRFFLAALGVFNFFKQIPCWWWILILLIMGLTIIIRRDRNKSG